MKHVKKAGVPHFYKAWRKTMEGTANEDYPNGLLNPTKGKLHEALLTEQGYLCAYTMKRIGTDTSHIEHIKPETLCRADLVGSDLDYENMLACFPAYGMERRYRYGAQERDDWWENGGADFVKPLDPNCEKRFCFDLDGNIKAVSNHAAAAKTIEKLGLAHSTLTEDRMRVIHEFVFGENGDDPLPVAKAKLACGTICSANKQGEFNEFCVAIRDGLVEHLKNLAKLSQKKKFARKK